MSATQQDAPRLQMAELNPDDLEYREVKAIATALPIFIGNEDPDTCPRCGSRLELVGAVHGEEIGGPNRRLNFCGSCVEYQLFEDDWED